MKTANSIVREAVPNGLFKGKSKQLYDALYLLTRGAVVPQRRVRISRPKLMAKAHIGSRVTFEANVRHLISVGLILVQQITGEHEGNEYEIFLPEEITTMPSHTTLTRQPSHAQKQGRLDSLESSQTSHTSSLMDSTTSPQSKTFSKDSFQRIDDEPAALALALLSPLAKAVLESTGRELAVEDAAGLANLGETLAAEFKRAEARAESVNAPGAFFATHLRRRLFKKEGTRPAAQTPQAVASGARAVAQLTEEMPLEEHVEIFTGLVRDGEYSLESLKLQFSEGFSEEDWFQIETGIKTLLGEREE